MRQELRRKLPRTQGCGAAIVVGILAIVAVGVWAGFKWLRNTPSQMVQKAMTRARSNDLEGFKQYLTQDSLTNPGSDVWVQELVAALGNKAVLDHEEIVGDEATVHVMLPTRSPTVGGVGRLDLGVHAVRNGRGWKIQLAKTMTSLSPQEWQSLVTQSGG